MEDFWMIHVLGKTALECFWDEQFSVNMIAFGINWNMSFLRVWNILKLFKKQVDRHLIYKL